METQEQLLQSQQMKAEEYDDHTTNSGDPALVRPHDLAQQGRGCPKRHEDETEAAHEKQRVHERGPPKLRAAALQFLHSKTRDEREVGGHQREHAGGKKREYASREGGCQTYAQ